MLEFKPESRVTLIDRVRTALPSCESVHPVDMQEPRSKRDFRSALDKSRTTFEMTPQPQTMVGISGLPQY